MGFFVMRVGRDAIMKEIPTIEGDGGWWTVDGVSRIFIASLLHFSMWVSSLIRLLSRLCDMSHRNRDLARGEIYARNLIKMAVVIGIPRKLIAATMGVLLDLGKMGDAI